MQNWVGLKRILIIKNLPIYPLVDFERLVAVVDIKIKGEGYGGSEIFYSVTPARSQIRFPLSKIRRFVIQTESYEAPARI